eukprot:6174940-Pleurochrysis_carterae.AAC.1
MTMRLELGTEIWYAPGEWTLRPRLMPTQALESMIRDTHNARFFTCEELIRGCVGLGRTAGAIKDVDGVRDGIVPESNGGTTRCERGSREFHDHRSDGAFSDAIQLMDVRWASGVVDAGRCKKFSELGRKKFAGVVAV